MHQLSKAKRVRDYLTENGDASPTEVAKALAEYNVSTAYVSNIKSELKKKATPTISTELDSKLEHIRAAGIFIKSCGGVERAKEVLNATLELVELLKS